MPRGTKKAFSLRLDLRSTTCERLAAMELRSVNAQMECLLREAWRVAGIQLERPEPRSAGVRR
jgi:hypothetical protein